MTVARSERGAEPRRVRAGAVSGLAVIAGGSDTLTGLGLIVAPGLVTRLLLVPAVDPDVWLRFIGAFVLGVGLAYLYPWLLAPAARETRLRVVLEVTAIVRGLVCLVVSGAVLAGALPLAWIGVAVFDGLLAVAQMVIVGPGGVGGD